ncbi:PPE domain-containing protein [Mycobacterium intracellulare]|uniref:PPE domain-containing protein n=1 Tax=Mycobacterium intracellulare TaxID=1767 RepID=UPI001CD9C360|nr:hypothetical protein [Mycobacterium intracellulare]MCA2304851.1 PPE domain-containing protein [Mycobacterium intracellulare]MCA2347118.1 PPE domain-containing protein [Mycobacterium intracellulare]
MLQVDVAGLQSAVAGLVTAAHSLAELGAQPPVHTPLATDETSTSVAARLSEHAAVMASRAADGAAVLAAGAKAITQSAVAYGQMDQANQAVVSLHGSPAPPAPGFSPAVTVNLVAPDVPIAPPAPRPAETTAAIMEAGQPAAGHSFVADCAALSEGFSSAARSARRGAATVSEHLKGEAAPRITAALNRYADWAQEMARHADTIGQLAGSHKDRFAQAKQATPTTTEFANRHRELHNAIALNSSYPSPGSAAAVAKAHTNLTQLTNHTQIVAAGYHTGETIPEAPPGPPPAPVIVEPGGGQGDTPQTPTQQGADPKPTRDHPGTAHAGDVDPATDPAGLDGLDGGEGDPAANPLAPAGAGGMPGMASSLPSMLTGLLGAGVGMATQIPQKLGQELQGLAQQATQSVAGLTQGMAGKNALDDAANIEPADSLGSGGGGGGGDDGATTPAASGGADLKPAASAISGMGSPASPPLAGASGTPPTTAAPAESGMGGPPMFMPPMGGMGAGAGSANRKVKDPDKSIEMPSRPNSEPIKGERGDPTRHTATVDAAAHPKDGSKRTVTVRSRSRRVDPDTGGGDSQ